MSLLVCLYDNRSNIVTDKSASDEGCALSLETFVAEGEPGAVYRQGTTNDVGFHRRIREIR